MCNIFVYEVTAQSLKALIDPQIQKAITDSGVLTKIPVRLAITFPSILMQPCCILYEIYCIFLFFHFFYDACIFFYDTCYIILFRWN